VVDPEPVDLGDEVVAGWEVAMAEDAAGQD
jgi:hypothetical protein